MVGRCWAVLACAVGCGRPHVELRPLPPDPSPQQRSELFARLRPTASVIERTTTCGGNGCTSSSSESMVLGDGSYVHYPEDLLPVLAPDSDVARAAERAASARSRGHWWLAGFLVGGLGSVVTIGAGVSSHDTAVTWLGIGMLGFGLVSAGGYTVNVLDERDATRYTYDRYPQQLAEQLRMCVHGFTIAPCEVNVPDTPPPMIPDPALGQLRQR